MSRVRVTWASWTTSKESDRKPGVLIESLLQQSERPQDLFQILMAFVEDSLVVSISNLTHHNEQITKDEKLSSTM